jgi:hypothetical protein
MPTHAVQRRCQQHREYVGHAVLASSDVKVVRIVMEVQYRRLHQRHGRLLTTDATHQHRTGVQGDSPHSSRVHSSGLRVR